VAVRTYDCEIVDAGAAAIIEIDGERHAMVYLANPMTIRPVTALEIESAYLAD